MQKQYACFSGAIRDGAKLRPQGRKKFFEEGKTCAVGAGAEAVFGLPLPHYSETYRAFPYLDAACGSTCPECDGPGTTLSSLIFHLNDDHQWSRERIADWLYLEEEKLGFITLTTEQDTESAASAALPEDAFVEVCSSLTR